MSTTLEQKKGNKIRSLSNTITSQYGIATGNQNLTKDNDEKQAKIIEEQRKKQKRQRTTKGSTIFGKDINYRLDEDDTTRLIVNQSNTLSNEPVKQGRLPNIWTSDYRKRKCHFGSPNVTT